MLTADVASQFSSIALRHVTREYPNSLLHVLVNDDDAVSPRQLHPVFYGSYDWHSCVHGYWMLATLLDRFPTLPQRHEILATFDTHLTPARVAGEVRYFERPTAQGYERPYGWAWLLALHGQLHRMSGTADADAIRWRDALQPLADLLVARFTAFLPKCTYPLRVGTHFNTAFALALALDYARDTANAPFAALLKDTAVRWYGEDRGYQGWEPAGDEFLSPGWMEAELMRRILPADAFVSWFDAFLPNVRQRQPAAMFVPATVTDRSDGKLAHLDGLNLSRAWCLRQIAQGLPGSDTRRALLAETANVHLTQALAQVEGDYMGEHWLATFALLALLAERH
ncbi:hypothetical protein WM40_06705 [Robbsia andropogonis]|uniref:DUF2891 domain-containing protein n=1 Tax=Robbsia andropogonis TaxID=28092 RepID=A0A0F5K3T2_9BURK|nr:DUF2891 domain-containing protein [Robbsia andropogonis]KKB64192.1 hypothetical protein WM40_06705 [Robbsia andropogonis]MCP1118745.1 DUF2891 domain-containing protein [Robbsia andropogonis]MCP1128212.1 DUF2891 domain-containing protein [Robbsia andropogonis]